MELLIIILASLLVAVFFVLIFNWNYKAKPKSNIMYNSDSKNSYPKAGDIFQTLEDANIQINFLGDSLGDSDEQ